MQRELQCPIKCIYTLRSYDDDAAYAHHIKTTSPAVVYLRCEFDPRLFTEKQPSRAYGPRALAPSTAQVRCF